MQIRSALPIRHALARQLLIKKGYDKMELRKRRALDGQIARELSENFDDRVVVRYEYGIRGDPENLGLVASGQQGVLLTADGKELHSAHTLSIKENWGWDSHSEEFTLVFPRMVDGKLAIKPRATKFDVLIGKREGSTFYAGSKFEYLLYKMIYRGKVEY